MIRIIFCGSRDWTDREMIRAAVRRYLEQFGPFELIHGDQRGADRIAGEIGDEFGLLVHPEPADWSRGKRGGPERNQRMLDLGPVFVVAFKDGFDFSLRRINGRLGGTEGMAKITAVAGVAVEVWSHAWTGPHRLQVR
jgi:hypothetical protein